MSGDRRRIAVSGTIVASQRRNAVVRRGSPRAAGRRQGSFRAAAMHR